MSKRSDMIKSEELLNKALREIRQGSKKKAFEFYEQSAKLGNDQAMYYLGSCYYNGIGTIKDEQKGFDCYFESANEGNLEAILALASFYQEGKFVDKNEEQAFQMYEIVYQNLEENDLLEEFPEVFNKLGMCYAKGIGTEIDKEKALIYLNNAVSLYDAYDDEIIEYMKAKDECKELIEELEK